GIIAAAGIVALTSMVDRLAEDHDNARALAEGLGRVAHLRVHPARRRTNMVFFEIAGGAERAGRFAAALAERDVLVGARSPVECRAVTHYGVSGADVQHAVEAAAEAAASTAHAGVTAMRS
ncbi:MAG: beta-eliminating lyase-related protein, partial [Candidatus Binataceae bacterium]